MQDSIVFLRRSTGHCDAAAHVQRCATPWAAAQVCPHRGVGSLGGRRADGDSGRNLRPVAPGARPAVLRGHRLAAAAAWSVSAALTGFLLPSRSRVPGSRFSRTGHRKNLEAHGSFAALALSRCPGGAGRARSLFICVHLLRNLGARQCSETNTSFWVKIHTTLAPRRSLRWPQIWNAPPIRIDHLLVTAPQWLQYCSAHAGCTLLSPQQLNNFSFILDLSR